MLDDGRKLVNDKTDKIYRLQVRGPAETAPARSSSVTGWKPPAARFCSTVRPAIHPNGAGRHHGMTSTPSVSHLHLDRMESRRFCRHETLREKTAAQFRCERLEKI